MLRSIILVFTSELPLCSNKMVLLCLISVDLDVFLNICPAHFNQLPRFLPFFSMTFLRGCWFRCWVPGAWLPWSRDSWRCHVGCCNLDSAIWRCWRIPPGGCHFLGKLRCGKPMVPTGKSSKNMTHMTHGWLSLVFHIYVSLPEGKSWMAIFLPRGKHTERCVFSPVNL